MEREFHTHGFGPVVSENSRLLILGSFPSVKSREEGFFYGHPRNRFWRVLAALAPLMASQGGAGQAARDAEPMSEPAPESNLAPAPGPRIAGQCSTGLGSSAPPPTPAPAPDPALQPVPSTVPEKKAFLLSNAIAVYDVVESCTVIGSEDSSIADVVPADIGSIIAGTNIGNRIYTNGGKAWQLYHKLIEPDLGIKAVKLPSTSPANATYSLDRLISEWKRLMGL